MIPLVMAAVMAVAGPCPDGLCNVRALEPYFTKLARIAPGGSGGRRVHILQIGDSHTAGDGITGAWRDLLQARYGSGGRGVLPPGRPFDGYITHGVTVTMSPGWKVASDFGAGWSSPSVPLGLSAFSLTSQVDGARMGLTADPGEQFDRLTVCAIARAGAGSLTLRAGSDSVDMALGSPTERPECRTLRVSEPAAAAEIVANGSPVTVTSWATFREASGVTLSNLGVVGSQLVHFSRTDDAVLAEELRTYQPDLIVLAFGTNEGFAPRFSPFEFEVTLRTQIGRLRRLAGNVPILLLGAPDALSRRAEMRTNAAGPPVISCGQPGNVAAGAAAPAETGMIGGIIDRLRTSLGMPATVPVAVPAPVPPPAPQSSSMRAPLFPPAGLAAVRQVQLRVAQSLGVAYWDWEGRMGGRCAADAWVHASPPLMRGDYVHYTSAGAREIAQRLQADLEKAANR